MLDNIFSFQLKIKRHENLEFQIKFFVLLGHNLAFHTIKLMCNIPLIVQYLSMQGNNRHENWEFPIRSFIFTKWLFHSVVWDTKSWLSQQEKKVTGGNVCIYSLVTPSNITNLTNTYITTPNLSFQSTVHVLVFLLCLC